MSYRGINYTGHTGYRGIDYTGYTGYTGYVD